jgi:hypothetical protein
VFAPGAERCVAVGADEFTGVAVWMGEMLTANEGYEGSSSAGES